MYLIPLSQPQSVELVIHALRVAGGEADCSGCPVRRVCTKQCLTIAAAVAQGRVIFGNIRRFVAYLLSCNLSEVLVVGLAILSTLPLPIMPLQILYLNLVTDVFPAFALAMGEGEPGILKRPPRRVGGHVRGRLVRGHAPALADACPCDNPLLARIEIIDEVLVREHLLRHV